jgi:hypothetical protein
MATNWLRQVSSRSGGCRRGRRRGLDAGRGERASYRRERRAGEAAPERSHPRKAACALAGDVGLVSSLEPLMFLRFQQAPATGDTRRHAAHKAWMPRSCCWSDMAGTSTPFKRTPASYHQSRQSAGAQQPQGSGPRGSRVPGLPGSGAPDRPARPRPGQAPRCPWCGVRLELFGATSRFLCVSPDAAMTVMSRRSPGFNRA